MKAVAAANAISILVAANVEFSGYDFSYIDITGANLRNGYFTGSNFTETNLTDVNLENGTLRKAIFNWTKNETNKIRNISRIFGACQLSEFCGIFT